MPLYRRTQQRAADLNVVIQEDVSAIKLVKAFNREPYESDRFNAVNWDLREARMKANMAMAVASPGQDFATYLAAVIIIVFGGYQVIQGEMTIGTLTAFYSYVLTMFAPVRWLTFVNQMGQQAMAAGERVFEILDTSLDVTEKPDAVALPRLEGRLELEDVSFAYGKGAPLLKGITATVEPGQTLALVGPSGSGKTTLINLIPRFYDVTQGAVRVDGHDVRDVALSSLRAQVGMVMQETFLFNLSIRDNICYGRAGAPQEEIEAAAKAAAAHDFIAEFPEGYETLIGERGVRLSGGQRQRLAIARAILVDPRILILDEATSSVDNRTDYLIRQALDGLMRGRTTVVIAHRLSTVQRAHQILVLEGGRVTARGAHAELLRSSPLYRHLYEIQFELQRDGTAPDAPDAPDAAVTEFPPVGPIPRRWARTRHPPGPRRRRWGDDVLPRRQLRQRRGLREHDARWPWQQLRVPAREAGVQDQPQGRGEAPGGAPRSLPPVPAAGPAVHPG